MITLKKVVIVAIAPIAVALGVAVPASADPGDDPCQLAVNFLCKFVPIAPDLDHDIDLTKNPADIDGQPLPQMPPAGDQDPENARPADICANGCM
jgi:hypothetical protein